MKTIRNLILTAFAVLLVAIGGRVVSAVTIGNEWFPLQTYHGGTVFVPVTKTAAFTASTSVTKYDLNTSGGAFIVSLPSSAGDDVPADGQCWEFSLTVAGNAASFSPSAVGDLLDATQGAYGGMDALGDSVKICYDSGTTNYYFQNRYIH